ncbi:uncharacterized protein G2W53_014602 [Senna tora]|uniref:Uncharacterized protein n=1 Tax=Senna tora TaxID=362788 RepID=A0A834WTR3_9FABA|nr:uncharacterized protein G2W53_014602 [Senna tora]
MPNGVEFHVEADMRRVANPRVVSRVD